jgi:hypothetical protein
MLDFEIDPSDLHIHVGNLNVAAGATTTTTTTSEDHGGGGSGYSSGLVGGCTSLI